MVNDFEALDNSQHVPVEARIAAQIMQQLRQVLDGERCIMCTSPIGPTNPVELTLYDMSICRQLACVSTVMATPVGELTVRGQS